MPPWVRWMSVSTWAASVGQSLWASWAIGISAGSLPCTRIQPQLRDDCSPATRPFSTTKALSPIRLR